MHNHVSIFKLPVVMFQSVQCMFFVTYSYTYSLTLHIHFQKLLMYNTAVSAGINFIKKIPFCHFHWQ